MNWGDLQVGDVIHSVNGFASWMLVDREHSSVYERLEYAEFSWLSLDNATQVTTHNQICGVIGKDYYCLRDTHFVSPAIK